MSGQGYRAIDHPDGPRHTHFPPGYPLLLAMTWELTGISVISAHVVSALCMMGASLAAWLWFRRMMPEPAAMLLGLAVAINWLWARTGAAIQSEPLYLLLAQSAILAAVRTGKGSSTRVRDAVVLGILLAACLLTRHAAIGLALAILLDLSIRRRWRECLAAGSIAAFLVSPWIAWMAMAAGPGGRTQAGLLVQGNGTLPERIAGQLIFYIQRIPDQITGPFVEVGTVFRHSTLAAIAANGWAIVATAVIVGGWVRTLRRPRRRLAGLIAIGTLLVLLPWPFTEAGRFLIPLIPCILIGAVEGLAGIANGIGRVRAGIGARRAPYEWLRPSRSRRLAAGLLLSASLPYSAYTLVAGRSRVMEASHGEFDAACRWLAVNGSRPGPVLTRHPGEVFWQTGRKSLEIPTAERPGDVDADVDAIARTIANYRVAYLLIDQERYALARTSPLARYVVEHPERVRKVWDREAGRSSVAIYEVREKDF